MGWTFYIYDPGWWPGDNPDDEASAAAAEVENAQARELRKEFEDRITELGGQRELRMPEVCSGDSVGVDLVVGVAGGLGTLALTWLGGKLREFMQKRQRGASGDVNAMRLVALYHLREKYPDAQPDIETIESMGETMPPDGVARPIRGVFLYRIRDLSAPRVFIVEVASNSELVSLAAHDNRW